jgi:hypothetical protein
MARPLKIEYSGPTAIGMKEMSDAEIDYIAHQVCTTIAAQTSGTGPLTLNVNGATGTSIGSFVDTWRPDAIGAHPVGTTINSATYTFKQNLTTDATAPTRPIEWSTDAMREMSDSALNTNIFNRVISRLSVPALGAYVLQPSAPATGTWSSVATVTDTAAGGNATTYLWRCTAYSAPTTVRPLKIFGADTKEMSDAELQSLFGKYTSYVTTSGPGTYAVQASAPTTGTWIRMGSAFSDTIEQVSNVGYATGFTGNYTGYYTGNYATSYSGGYSGTYTTAYAGAYTGYYTGNYAASYTGFYSGYNGVQYVRGYYAGSRNKTFTGYYTGYYNRSFTGTYTGYYAGSRNNTYSGTYSGTYTGYFIGLTVISTKDSPSNVSLWLRIA